MKRKYLYVDSGQIKKVDLEKIKLKNLLIVKHEEDLLIPCDEEEQKRWFEYAGLEMPKEELNSSLFEE